MIMDKISQSLIQLLANIPISMWGISDITGFHHFNTTYNRTISLAQAYSYRLDDYSSTNFNDFLLGKVKSEIEKNIEIIKNFLEKENISYYIVSNRQKDPILSIGEFSHKFAAVQGGLGWIGKNGLVITKKYGPRVRLSTILVDLDLPFNHYEEKDGCGECNICVESCPTRCLYGDRSPNRLVRENVIDIFKCKDKNEKRKGHICGLCLVSCPIGELVRGRSLTHW